MKISKGIFNFFLYGQQNLQVNLALTVDLVVESKGLFYYS